MLKDSVLVPIAQCPVESSINTRDNLSTLHNCDPRFRNSRFYADGLRHSSRSTSPTGNETVTNPLLGQDEIDFGTTIQPNQTKDHNSPLADSVILKNSDRVESEPDATMTKLVYRSDTPEPETEQLRNESKQFIDIDDDEISKRPSISQRPVSVSTLRPGKSTSLV